MAGNYNVKMTQKENSIVITIPDLDADFGPAAGGRNGNKRVAFGKVWFTDSRGKPVTVQVMAFAKQ